jgi:hypothetical protein
MTYDMRNYLYLIDYANILPGTVEHAILEPAFADSEIEAGDLSSVTKNLKLVKSEDGVKVTIYMGIIKLSWTNEWSQFDNLLERIDKLLDDMKIDNFLSERGQFGSRKS